MKQNLKNEEDEIQVLGSVNNRQVKNLPKWIYIIMAVIILLMLFLYYLSRPKENPPAPPIDAGLSVRADSINDVAFDIYPLHDLSAELQIGLPDIRDTSIVLVVQADDVIWYRGNGMGHEFGEKVENVNYLIFRK